VEEVFWGVAMKPGRPVAFGVRRDHLVFNLPGNPVSALVCFELLVRPAVGALLGLPDPVPAFRPAVLGHEVSRNPERDEFLRGRRDGQNASGELRVRCGAGQESHMIVSAAQNDLLVEIPRGESVLDAGSSVRILPLV
jgi:molybdopterin molybdotransferase